MADNPFDQFDAPTQQPNVFDQFDAQPAPQIQTVGPSGSLGRDIVNRAGSALNTTLSGIAGMPRAIAQGVDWLGSKAGQDIGADQYLASKTSDAFGQKVPTFPTAEEYAANLSQGIPKYKPDTAWGQLGQAAIDALPAAVMNPKSIPEIVGGNVTGEGLSQLFPDHPVISRIVGMLTGGGLARSGVNAAARAGNIAVGAGGSPLLSAYTEEGVPTNLAGDVSQNPSMRAIQAIASKTPGARDAVAEASQNAVNGFGDALERRASMLGNSTTMQEGGQALQSAANDWLSKFKADQQAGYNKLDMLIPGQTPVDTSAYRTALSDVRNSFKSAPETGKVLQNPQTASLLDALTTDAPGGYLPWETVRNIRTRLGEQLSDPAMIATPGIAEVKRLYKGLSSDLENTAGQVSPQASALYHDLNAQTQAGHQFIDQHLSNIVGDGVAPEDAASYALGQAKKGGTRLTEIQQELPGGVNELAAAKLRTMGQANPGAQGVEAGTVSPTTFATNVNKLAPEASQALFGSNPEVARGVDNLRQIGSTMKETEKLVNHSNTGGQVHGQIGLLTALEMARAGAEGARDMGLPGWLGGAAGAGTGLLAPKALGGVMGHVATSSPLARFMATPGTNAQPLSLPGKIGVAGLLGQ